MKFENFVEKNLFRKIINKKIWIREKLANIYIENCFPFDKNEELGKVF